MSEVTTTIPITANALPDGNLWEADGSCWQARVDARETKGWRWFPMNWDAFAKGEPTGEMGDCFWLGELNKKCTCPKIIGRDTSFLDVTREPCPFHPSRYL